MKINEKVMGKLYSKPSKKKKNMWSNNPDYDATSLK